MAFVTYRGKIGANRTQGDKNGANLKREESRAHEWEVSTAEKSNLGEQQEA